MYILTLLILFLKSLLIDMNHANDIVRDCISFVLFLLLIVVKKHSLPS